MKRLIVLTMAATLLLTAGGIADAQMKILVYDNDARNDYAQQAAHALSADVTVTNASNFNARLKSQCYDLVLVDCPNDIPAGGWREVIDYVNGGGRVVMSFWDWDNDSGYGDPGLGPAFGFTSAASITLVDGVSTLTAAPTEAGAYVASGPGMPHSSWSGPWIDDGDAFGFTGGSAIAYLSGYAEPVVIENAAGNAIAAFLIDEWAGPGGVEFWGNLAQRVLDQPYTCPPPAIVPTVNEWGMMILVLLMVASALFFISRKKRIV